MTADSPRGADTDAPPSKSGLPAPGAETVDPGDGSSMTSRVLPKTPPLRPEQTVRGEIWRKGLHALPGLLPFLLAPVPHPDPLDFTSKAVVVVICVLLTLLFLSQHRLVRRRNEDGLFLTVVSYPATVIATMLLFPAHVELTGVVVVVLAFGDTAAYIGGRWFGVRKLPWNPEKTWMGTLCFVAVGGPLATLAYASLAPGTSVPVAVACGMTAAVAAAVAESLPVRLTDNLRVGLAAALGAASTHAALVGLSWF